MPTTVPEPSGPSFASVVGPPPVSTEGVRRRRAYRRWLAAVVLLGVAGAVFAGWTAAARAATTDRLETLAVQLDEQVRGTRVTSERLVAVIAVAQNAQANAVGADPAARATLDEAIRSAESVLEQRLTTREPGSVAQAEMLVRQASGMEESLELATADLRTAVDRVRVDRDDVRPVRHAPAGDPAVVVQP